MKLTKKEIERYRNELGDLSERAGLFVSGQLLSFMEEFPGGTVAEIREEAKEIIEDALGIYGDQAATMAADFFDEIMKAEGVAVTSEIYDTIDREQMDSKVRYFARDLVEGNLTGFALKASDVTRYYVKRQAYDNMVRNCYENDVRYARVPSGSETCGFCFMLCSRGFVYHTEGAAKGKSNHGMHNHCDCIIVPGVKGVTKIQGYDPESMEERWEQCRKTCGSNKPKDIMAECETRDPRWLYTGKTLKTGDRKKDYALFSGKQYKNELSDFEKKGHDLLWENGFAITPLPNDRKAKANIDLVMNGVHWELKTPDGGGDRLGYRIDEGVSKWLRLHSNGEILNETPKMVIDNRFSEIKDEDALKILTGRMKKHSENGFDEAIFIDKEGRITRLRNS